MEQIPLGCLNEESITRLPENFSHGFPWGGEGMVVGAVGDAGCLFSNAVIFWCENLCMLSNRTLAFQISLYY